MEEPQIINEEGTTKQQQRKSNKGRNVPGSPKRRLSGVALSYIIVLIAFAVGIIVCSVDGGMLDVQITKYFSDLGHDPLNLDGSPNIWYQLGNFFDPDLTESEFWEDGLMGQLISYVPINW